MCPPLVRICLLVAPLQTVWYGDLFDHIPSLEHVQDSSAIPEHGERRSKNTWAQYSSGIKSKYKFEYKYRLRSNFRAPNFGGACPQTPLIMRFQFSYTTLYKYNCMFISSFMCTYLCCVFYTADELLQCVSGRG